MSQSYVRDEYLLSALTGRIIKGRQGGARAPRPRL